MVGSTEKREGTTKGATQGPDLGMLKRLVLTGHTDAEIVHLLGINRTTLFRWKKRPDVAAIYQSGKEELVKVLEHSLYRKALGVQTVEQEYRLREVKKKSGKVAEKLVLEKETHKTLAPDTLALIFSLKNLSPEAWKDKHEYLGEQVVEIALKDVKTKADIDRIKAILQARMDKLRAQGEVSAPKEPFGLLAPAQASNTGGGENPVANHQ